MNDSRQRIREILEIPGKYFTGPKNSITDVKGVRVGHHTIHNHDLHTGVTIIEPHGKNPFYYKTPCAIATGNGFGKLVGKEQIEELGELESLIGLTNTMSVGQVMQGILDYHLQTTSEDEMKSINVLVGETNDSFLSNIRSCSIKPEHVLMAINNLSEHVEEGAVGAGSGTVCFGYKGGIGTSSRILPKEVLKTARDYTVGALVQSNYGGNLKIYGKEYGVNPLEEEKDKGSCMIVIATDAPLDARQLKRCAKRGLLGLVNTGSYMSHGSGDFAICFSNYEKNLRHFKCNDLRSIELLSDLQLSPFFNAIVEAVTEALYNSMTMAVDVEGYSGNRARALRL